jgi:hypothetical protein
MAHGFPAEQWALRTRRQNTAASATVYRNFDVPASTSGENLNGLFTTFD